MKKEDAIIFFGVLFRGKHHIPGKIKEFGYGFCVNCYNDFATFDMNLLTRLVFLAHDFCYRAAIHHSGPKMLKICIWKRKREGRIQERHPTLEQAFELWRNYNKVTA